MLYRIKKGLMGVCISFIALTFQANAYQQCESVAQGLQNLIKRTNSTASIGVVVQSMDTGRIYYSKNATQFFAPASVQKLFTVSAALLNLTPEYRFPTRLLTTGTVTNGVLNGDAIFQFSGDPSLTQTNVAELVKKLKLLGITKIAGKVIIDNTAYDHIPYPAGWSFDDLTSDYAAPLNTVIINRNRFGIAFIPGKKAGEKPTLDPQLPPGSATFFNDTTTTNYPQYSCPLKVFSNEHNQYMIKGCLARNQGIQRRAFAIRNMEMYTQGLLREFLRQQSITLTGGFETGKAPENAEVRYVNYSKPLSQLIVHLLKSSDNLYADSLLKKLGEKYNHRPGSWENGLYALKPTLSKHAGIDASVLHLNDGAGLSEYNKVMPQTVSQLLYFIEHNPMLRETLIPALPIAGVDGTLAGRMPILAKGKLLHAKTGSMGGVSTLAGFVKTAHHGLLSFVIMINNVPKNRSPYIVLENHIGEFLARANRC